MSAIAACSSLFVCERVEGLPPAGPVLGWATWKGDRIHDHAIHATKSSLLIGYDMMPLIGLDCCEIALADRGVSVAPTAARIAHEGELYDCWAVSVQNRLVPYMLEYSVCSTGVPEASLKTTAGFIGHVAEDTAAGKKIDADLKVHLAPEDAHELNRYWWALEEYFTRRDYRRLQGNAHAILARLDIRAVKLKFDRIDISGLPSGSEILSRRNCNTRRGREWLAKRDSAPAPSVLREGGAK